VDLGELIKDVLTDKRLHIEGVEDPRDQIRRRHIGPQLDPRHASLADVEALGEFCLVETSSPTQVT
jgi:hypothetical protein